MVAAKDQTNNWSLRNSLKKQYGGKWFVIGCERDEFCSVAQADLKILEQLDVAYGQGYWAVFRF